MPCYGLELQLEQVSEKWHWYPYIIRPRLFIGMSQRNIIERWLFAEPNH